MEHAFFFHPFAAPNCLPTTHLRVFHDHWLSGFVGYLLFCRDHPVSTHSITPSRHASLCVTPRFLGTRYQGYEHSTCAPMAGCRNTCIHAGQEPYMSSSRPSRRRGRLPQPCGAGDGLMKGPHLVERVRTAYLHEPREMHHHDLDSDTWGHHSNLPS